MTIKFSVLPVKTDLLANIESLNYQQMTPIQAASLPIILDGKDLLAQAKTGSGKTAAFAIGLLNKLDIQNYRTQSLVLCPTRELADQVSQEIRRLARTMPNTRIVTLCGGKPMSPQLNALARAPHIVVGTPGRILKHLEKATLKLDTVEMLVLDEADRMLDMGFHDDILRVIDSMPSQKQTLLFSATYPDEIKNISRKILVDPVEARVESTHHNNKIKQIFYQIETGQRTDALVALLSHYQPESTVIFCNRKKQCQDLTDVLWRQGFHALALHGDLEQKTRDQVLIQFSNKSSSVLIATDVASRGLDIKDLAAVINFELSPDPEIHIHRIGRTGRAGNNGLALSLYTTSEQQKISRIEEQLNLSVQKEKMSSLKANSTTKLIPPMVTLCIHGGRKNKIRAGDILGALTASSILNGDQIGKIVLADTQSFVAVERSIASQALKILSEGKIKGRQFKARKLH